MSDFFPKEYEVPQKAGNYFRFQDGENRFRILSAPLLGWEAWIDTPDGGRKPIRRPMNNPFSTNDIDDPEQIKHFMAFVVYNLDAEKIQILEITQKGLQKSIRALERSKAWGSPLQYNILVTKKGQKLDTEYTLVPEPPTKLDKGIEQLYKDMAINLEALFDGADPFAVSEEKETESIADDAIAAGL